MTIYVDADGVRRYLEPGWTQDAEGAWVAADDKVPDDA